MLWRYVLRPLFFRINPERAHYVAMGGFHVAAYVPGFTAALRACYAVKDARLENEVFGIKFPNPIGLAAGFDKEARWFNELASLGFGHIEVGTLTAHPQPGNPKPRLFRLPEDEALLNRLGFNNQGSKLAAENLKHRRIDPILGINIGKSKVTELGAATADYLLSFERLFEHARYVTVNVSSPNTPNLRALQDREPLEELLAALTAKNNEMAAARATKPKPILLKVAPDLNESQVDDVAEIICDKGLAGIIATNTTIERAGLKTDQARVKACGDGGVSGRPLTLRSREFVASLHRRLQGRVPIVGVGGVFTADDAWEMMRAGASLVQVYTGFVYSGPGFVSSLNRGLVKRLEREGCSSINEIIGTAVAE